MSEVKIGKDSAVGLSGEQVLIFQEQANKFKLRKLLYIGFFAIFVLIIAGIFPQTQQLLTKAGEVGAVSVSIGAIYKIVEKFKK